MARRRRLRVWLGVLTGIFAALLIAAGLIWRDDILEALLDPKIPYAVYKPPPPPDYALASAWTLLPGTSGAATGPVDIFFVHPTTFDGGKDWNGPVRDRRSAATLARVMLPNYAAPFALAGRVFAPRYRQASLYTSLTLFDDAIEAREFAYEDVRAAFGFYLSHFNHGRPFILVGVEQGGVLAARLLRDVVGPSAALKERLVAAYLIETVVPADEFGPAAPLGACARRDQSGCVLAWASARRLDFGRALRILNRSIVWNDRGRLVGLGGRPPLCVNPLLGVESDEDAPARLNLGAANATGLEWGVRPGFMVRQVGAQCEGGILRVTTPRSASLRPSGDWADRLKVPGYNLFYADLEADALRRVAAYESSRRVQP
jgi:hypothetical protein